MQNSTKKLQKITKSLHGYCNHLMVEYNGFEAEKKKKGLEGEEVQKGK